MTLRQHHVRLWNVVRSVRPRWSRIFLWRYRKVVQLFSFRGTALKPIKYKALVCMPFCLHAEYFSHMGWQMTALQVVIVHPCSHETRCTIQSHESHPIILPGRHSLTYRYLFPPIQTPAFSLSLNRGWVQFQPRLSSTIPVLSKVGTHSSCWSCPPSEWFSLDRLSNFEEPSKLCSITHEEVRYRERPLKHLGCDVLPSS